jgi:hypothetical protein
MLTTHHQSHPADLTSLHNPKQAVMPFFHSYFLNYGCIERGISFADCEALWTNQLIYNIGGKYIVITDAAVLI